MWATRCVHECSPFSFYVCRANFQECSLPRNLYLTTTQRSNFNSRSERFRFEARKYVNKGARQTRNGMEGKTGYLSIRKLLMICEPGRTNSRRRMHNVSEARQVVARAALVQGPQPPVRFPLRVLSRPSLYTNGLTPSIHLVAARRYV